MAPLARTLAAVTVLTSGTLAAQTDHSPADTVGRLLRAAEVQHFRGELGEARATLDLADSAARRHCDTAALARVWIARAGVWLSQTTATNTGYAEADSAAIHALGLAERSGNSSLVADATDLLGRTLYARAINLDQGDYDRPLAHFRRALDLRKAAGNTRGIVESMFRVGLIHERKDESERAIAIYEAAMRLAGDAYPLERSNLARHLAYQRQGQGDLDRAVELFDLSLALREEAGYVLTRPSALTSLGDAYRRRGDYVRALEYGSRALAEAERLAASRFVVGALISLGQTHGAMGDRAAALERLGQAESLAARIGYVSGVARAGAEREKLDSLRTTEDGEPQRLTR